MCRHTVPLLPVITDTFSLSLFSNICFHLVSVTSWLGSRLLFTLNGSDFTAKTIIAQETVWHLKEAYDGSKNRAWTSSMQLIDMLPGNRKRHYNPSSVLFACEPICFYLINTKFSIINYWTKLQCDIKIISSINISICVKCEPYNFAIKHILILF